MTNENASDYAELNEYVTGLYTANDLRMCGFDSGNHETTVLAWNGTDFLAFQQVSAFFELAISLGLGLHSLQVFCLSPSLIQDGSKYTMHKDFARSLAGFMPLHGVTFYRIFFCNAFSI